MIRFGKYIFFIFLIFPGAASAADGCLINFAANSHLRPHEFLDKDGRFKGFDVALAEEAAKRMGCELKIIDSSWKEKETMLENGTADMATFVNYHEYPDDKFLKIHIHAIVHYWIVADRDYPFSDPAGGNLYIPDNSIPLPLIRRSYPNAEIKTLPDDKTVLKKILEDKNSAGILNANFTLYYIISQKSKKLKVIGLPFFGGNLYFAFGKNNAEKAARMSKVLSDMKNDGSYYEILTSSMVRKEIEPLYKIIFIVVAGSAALTTLFLLWNASLKRMVMKKTKSLTNEINLRKKTEAAMADLRDEAFMASKLATLGEIALGIAHEINNPVGIIRLNLPILEDFYENPETAFSGESKKEAERALFLINDSVIRIKKTVDDMKTYSVKANQAYEPVNLCMCLETAANLARQAVIKCTDRFEISFGSHIPLIKGDRRQIEHMILNIIQNSCNALTARSNGIYCSVYFLEKEKNAVVEIKDEGAGIPENIIKKVTSPFFTTRRESGGTGLGLSIVSRMMKEHGGTLKIVSREGAGTSVQLIFPTIRDNGGSH